jgi:hypothetical protein
MSADIHNLIQKYEQQITTLTIQNESTNAEKTMVECVNQ